MKKLSNTKAELKKSVAYKKSVYINLTSVLDSVDWYNFCHSIYQLLEDVYANFYNIFKRKSWNV